MSPVNVDPDIKEDLHKFYTQKWQDMRILNATGGDLVYVDNLLVHPKSERPDLIAKSHQSRMNFESIFASQRKYLW